MVVLPESAKISPSERGAVLHAARRYLSTTVEQMREGLVAGPVSALKLAITWSVTTDDDIASGLSLLTWHQPWPQSEAITRISSTSNFCACLVMVSSHSVTGL